MVKECTAQMDRTLRVAELPDEVKGYIVSHRLDLTGGRGAVALADGEDFTLGHVDADEETGIRAHFELWTKGERFPSRVSTSCADGSAATAVRTAQRAAWRARTCARWFGDCAQRSPHRTSKRGADGSLLITVGDDGLVAFDRLAVLADVE